MINRIITLLIFIVFVGFSNDNFAFYFGQVNTQQKKIDIVLIIEKIQNKEFDIVLNSICQPNYFEKKQSKLLSKTDKALLLTHFFLERLKHKTDLTQDKLNGLIENYHKNCGYFTKNIINSFKQQKNFSQGQKYWLLNEAKLLLNYVRPNVVEKNNYSYLLTIQWLYFNLLEDHVAAEKTIRLAIDNHSSKNTLINLVDKYDYLGTSLLNQGRLQEALLYMRKGLAIMLEYSLTEKYSDAYFSVAFTYLNLGDYASARRYFELSKTLDEKNNSIIDNKTNHCYLYPVEAAKSLVQLGKIDRLTGNSQSALIKHDCAIKSLSTNSDYYYYVARLEKAKDLLKLNKLNEAKNEVNDFIKNKALFVRHRLQLLLLLLKIDIQSFPFVYNKKTEEEIIKLLGNNNDYPLESIELEQLRMMHASMVQNDNLFKLSANQGFKIITKYKRQINNSDTWLSAQYSFVESYVNSIYLNNRLSELDKIEILIRTLDKNYSLDYSHQFKVNTSGSISQIASSKLKKLWSHRLNAEQALIKASAENKYKKQIALDEAKDAYKAYQLIDIKESNASKYDDIEHYALNEIQQKIAKNEIIVRYFISHKQHFAIALTQVNAFLYEVPEQQILRKKLSSIKAATISKSIVSQMMDSDLIKLLPKQLLKSNQFNKLIIIPDDVLHRLPFSAISITSKAPYRPLSNQLEVIRTHSIKHYLFANSKTIKNKTTNKMTVLADPKFNQKKLITNLTQENSTSTLRNWSNNLTRLIYSAKEAKSIEKLYQKAGENDSSLVNVIMGADFTNQMMMSDATRLSSILHIATHGFYDPSIPDVVGIATSPEQSASTNFSQNSTAGFLSLTQLLSKPFYNHLVVVSGCETMLGEYYKGSGMKSLTRGLLTQGAGSVIGTLWKIPDHSTAQFMQHFYAALKQNKGNTPKALQQAKKTLQNDEDYYDPFYWAGFVLTSKSQQYNIVDIN